MRIDSFKKTWLILFKLYSFVFLTSCLNPGIVKEPNNHLETNSYMTKSDLKLIIGSDHKGFRLKQSLISLFQKKMQILDYGTDLEDEASDYPDHAQKVAQEVQRNPGSFGVLICKTGTGMVLAANRFKGIRAILCNTVEEAAIARKHYDANILVLSGSKSDIQNASEIVNKFISTEFEPGKNKKTLRRIEKLDSL